MEGNGNETRKKREQRPGELSQSCVRPKKKLQKGEESLKRYC